MQHKQWNPGSPQATRDFAGCGAWAWSPGYQEKKTAGLEHRHQSPGSPSPDCGAVEHRQRSPDSPSAPPHSGGLLIVEHRLPTGQRWPMGSGVPAAGRGGGRAGKEGRQGEPQAGPAGSRAPPPPPPFSLPAARRSAREKRREGLGWSPHHVAPAPEQVSSPGGGAKGDPPGPRFPRASLAKVPGGCIAPRSHLGLGVKGRGLCAPGAKHAFGADADDSGRPAFPGRLPFLWNGAAFPLAQGDAFLPAWSTRARLCKGALTIPCVLCVCVHAKAVEKRLQRPARVSFVLSPILALFFLFCFFAQLKATMKQRKKRKLFQVPKGHSLLFSP